MIVTYESYLGGTWLITAQHDSGAVLDALVQSDWDEPDLVTWLRGKSWPDNWRRSVQMQRSRAWLWAHEHEEFKFAENVDKFMEGAPARFCPVFEDVRMPESWFLYFYTAYPIDDASQSSEDYVWTVLQDGTVKPGYDDLRGFRFYIVDRLKTQEAYVG